MKKLFRFLIPLIASGTLYALYSLFEIRILKSLSTWPKETEPQNILRTIFGGISVLVFLLSYWIIRLKEKELMLHNKIIKNESAAKVLPHWKFHDKITLGLGSYHDVKTKNGEKFFRITLKDISQRDMPPPYESPDSVPKEIKTDVATLGFTPGFFIYPGFRVKRIHDSSFSNESTFYMCKSDYQEESDSVFFFKTQHVTDGEYFFRCFVDHINPIKKEVELNIYFIWENPAQQKHQADRG
ncbi:MAG: hypothetical protein M0Z61_11300 [Nitrospiraceae bacterium]|nr:hypothetical protein [Nitrospiraceae bacterium]MDA8106467.1 hypothetical protein [Nitrospiraceae bacterium]